MIHQIGKNTFNNFMNHTNVLMLAGLIYHLYAGDNNIRYLYSAKSMMKHFIITKTYTFKQIINLDKKR